MTASEKTVLLVDDDRQIVQGTGLRLRAAGYKTIEAFDGTEALAQVKAHKPDAVLLDVTMPGISGIDVLRALKAEEQTRDIPVVMLSASLMHEPEAMECGALCFLPKPYNGATLLATLESVLHEN